MVIFSSVIITSKFKSIFIVLCSSGHISGMLEGKINQLTSLSVLSHPAIDLSSEHF